MRLYEQIAVFLSFPCDPLDLLERCSKQRPQMSSESLQSIFQELKESEQSLTNFQFLAEVISS